MKEEIFISTMTILILFNIFVTMVNPNVSSILNQDLTGILVTAIAVITGGSVISIVLGETVLRVVFATLIIFNVLFQVNLYSFTIGLGLCNTVFNVFNNGDMLGFGYLIGGILAFVAFFSGMLIVVESA